MQKLITASDLGSLDMSLRPWLADGWKIVPGTVGMDSYFDVPDYNEIVRRLSDGRAIRTGAWAVVAKE